MLPYCIKTVGSKGDSTSIRCLARYLFYPLINLAPVTQHVITWFASSVMTGYSKYQLNNHYTLNYELEKTICILFTVGVALYS